MYAITVDQRGSQTSDDLVPSALEDLGRGWQTSLLLAPERTAGDEFQTLVGDSRAAVEIALHLTRDGRWSVGIGLGEVQSPLPDSVRAARGSALVNARYAVDRAKRSKNGLAVQAVGTGAADAQALLRLLQELRARRSAEGWEVYDLLALGLTQRETASRLGISEGAVSLRVRAACLAAEAEAMPAIIRVLETAAER